MTTWDVRDGIGGTATIAASALETRIINYVDNNVGTVFNVREYGATGNGVTDDAAAIQAALTAASAAGGGTVQVPPGTYIINKYLLISSNVSMLGAGIRVSTIKCGSGFTAGGTAPIGAGYSMLQTIAASGNTNITVSGITFDGNESANRATLVAAAGRVVSFLVDMRGVTSLILDRIETKNTWTYNIMVKDCVDFAVARCRVTSPNTTGVYNQLDGIHILGSNGGRVVDNYVDNGIGSDADDALVCHVITGGNPCYDILYEGNVARSGPNGNGIQIAGDTVLIRDIVINGNVFWGSRRGIFTNFYAASGNLPIRSLTISGNTVRDTTLFDAILIHCAADGKWEDVTITGNVIDGYGNATNPNVFGIGVEGANGSRGITISGNTLRNGYARGIWLGEGASQTQDYTVIGNVIDMQAATAAPLAIVSGSKDGIIANNTIVGRGTTDGTGIFMTSTVANQATNQAILGNRIRAINTGVALSNVAGNNPTNTILLGNNTQGCTTGYSPGTAAWFPATAATNNL